MTTRLSKLAVPCVALAASLAGACSDSGSPGGTPDVAGRYLMITSSGQPLPAIISVEVGSPPLRGYDSIWVVADTLWLRPDSTAEELGAFLVRRADASGETPNIEHDTTVVRGTFRVTGADVTVRTWASTDDTLTMSTGGAQVARRVQIAPFTSRPRALVTYRRLP